MGIKGDGVAFLREETTSDGKNVEREAGVKDTHSAATAPVPVIKPIPIHQASYHVLSTRTVKPVHLQ